MLENVAMDIAVEERMLLLQRLRAKEVRIITSAQVKEILDDGVVIVRHGQEEAIQGMDRVILAMGTQSVDELSQRIRDEVAEVYVIGDAKEPRKALEAIHEGAEISRKI
jgi:2,4-dienoyl-CoA reductase (NADPH2)